MGCLNYFLYLFLVFCGIYSLKMVRISLLHKVLH